MKIFWINYILICIICYFTGAIPFAYLILKKKFHIDITKAGSGNVGAMNGYEISGSKKTGILIFILDFLKGMIPSLVVLYVLKIPFQLAILPILLLMAGHNYSVWLGFKGGRGLSTAAGIAVAVNFWMLVIWCSVYLITINIKKNIHVANIAATILLPVIVILPGNFFIKFSDRFSTGDNFPQVFFAFTAILCGLIFIRHIGPLMEFFRSSVKK
ncbi:MAG TPA: glycerol-3-phosphate acyltransferase [Ignavibacteria bacterium]|nr:glycerol-3-phosphate acyltransferase [Ignavibacteria bacterium]